jgi:hypothetical protein
VEQELPARCRRVYVLAESDAECVEVKFCELRLCAILGSSAQLWPYAERLFLCTS